MLSALIEWGDGSSERLKASTYNSMDKKSHTYSSAGTYTVKLRMNQKDSDLYTSVFNLYQLSSKYSFTTYTSNTETRPNVNGIQYKAYSFMNGRQKDVSSQEYIDNELSSNVRVLDWNYKEIANILGGGALFYNVKNVEISNRLLHTLEKSGKVINALGKVTSPCRDLGFACNTTDIHGSYLPSFSFAGANFPNLTSIGYVDHMFECNSCRIYVSVFSKS